MLLKNSYKEIKDKIDDINSKSKYPIAEIFINMRGEEGFPLIVFDPSVTSKITVPGSASTILFDPKTGVSEGITDLDYKCKENTKLFDDLRSGKTTRNSYHAVDYFNFQRETLKYGYFSVPVKIEKPLPTHYSPVTLGFVDNITSALYTSSECLIDLAAMPPSAFVDKYGFGIRQTTVILKDNIEVDPKEISLVMFNLISIFRVYNEYVLEEYFKKKDNEDYRRRHMTSFHPNIEENN